MRIVLDTNVFISGIFFSGPPSQILKAWKDKNIQIVLSEAIHTEYQRVGEELSTKYSEIDIGPIIDLITIYGEVVETKDLSVSICEDPDDNKFIECAISSNCKIIVSGDRHLLNISGFQDIEVLKPREFIDLHLK
jgi:putative PIN family toxin of toxin-antitoxin system